MKYALAFLMITIGSLRAFSQETIVGKVLDAANDQPLPFTTITFSGTTVGTVSNANGEFTLRIGETVPSDSISISYIGYKTSVLSINQLTNAPIVKLEAALIQLEELVVRALSPQEYLLRAVRKYPVNYAIDPFNTTAYYREIFTENDNYVTYNEAVFYSAYPEYQDTIPNQHQLALFRSKSEKEDIDFMSTWVEKKTEKEKKKALKKGEEWEEEDQTTRDIIQMGFGGPEQILSMDLMKETEYCLDTTKFKKFKYAFGQNTRYQGRELMEILFESKGQVDNQKMKGKIYLDLETDAIVQVSYDGRLIIPALIKPILFAFGLSIDKPIFRKSLKYQYHEGRWYPDTFQWAVDLGLKKRYVFQSNEISSFTGSQIFKINQLELNQFSEIGEEQRFDPKEDPAEQINARPDLGWNTINTLPIEKLKSK